MTEEGYLEKWDYAFSHDRLDEFRKRYGEIAYNKGFMDGRGFVII